jgi:hypothetical protein
MLYRHLKQQIPLLKSKQKRSVGSNNAGPECVANPVRHYRGRARADSLKRLGGFAATKNFCK